MTDDVKKKMDIARIRSSLGNEQLGRDSAAVRVLELLQSHLSGNPDRLHIACDEFIAILLADNGFPGTAVLFDEMQNHWPYE